MTEAFVANNSKQTTSLRYLLTDKCQNNEYTQLFSDISKLSRERKKFNRPFSIKLSTRKRFETKTHPESQHREFDSCARRYQCTISVEKRYF